MKEKGIFNWWRDGVIYQIYPLSFRDSDGDGFGDLGGITASLDYLADLGIDAIWLSPINPSPKFDWGYDVSDYENIDPILGTMDDFTMLLEEAHSRGIRVIMDMGFNHTSHEHPWFKESRSSRENAKADWYIWRDKPNNWASLFGGSAWTYVKNRGQYYCHLFLKEQPDLNWRNREVSAEILRIMKFWLDKGVDGFRLDVSNAYIKDIEFRNNPTRWNPLKIPTRQEHIYDRDRPEVFEIHRTFRKLTDSYPERFMVGEICGGDLPGRKISDTAKYAGADRLHTVFDFLFMYKPWSPRGFSDEVAAWEKALPAGAWPCYVLSNHDVPRHISRYGKEYPDERAKVAAAMLLTFRGTPFLYYGEEIGMRQVFIPPWKLKDTIARRYWPLIRGRDGCRTPMQWSRTKNAGFGDGKPWLPVGKSYREYNAADEKNDPNSILSFYRMLIRLRKNTPALQRGSYRALIANPETVMAYLRETEKQKILVMLNFFSRRERISFADETVPAGKWRIIFSNVERNGALEIHGIELAPYEVLIAEAE